MARKAAKRGRADDEQDSDGVLSFVKLLLVLPFVLWFIAWYCQLNSRRNKNRESDKINRRSSSDQLTIALTQIASSQTANLDFITAR
jgi:hypothetical protein